FLLRALALNLQLLNDLVDAGHDPPGLVIAYLYTHTVWQHSKVVTLLQLFQMTTGYKDQSGDDVDFLCNGPIMRQGNWEVGDSAKEYCAMNKPTLLMMIT